VVELQGQGSTGRGLLIVRVSSNEKPPGEWAREARGMLGMSSPGAQFARVPYLTN